MHKDNAVKGAVVFVCAVLFLCFVCFSSNPSHNLTRSMRSLTEIGLPSAITNVRADIEYSYGGFNYTLEGVLLPRWYMTKAFRGKPEILLRQNDSATYEKMSPSLKGPANQDAEDVDAIKHFFNGYRGGVVMELGAMDGLEYSVSKTLDTLFGWRSILVEADPEMAKSCRKNRPNAVSVNMVACSSPKKLHWAPSTFKNGRVKRVGALVELAEKNFLKRFHGGLFDDKAEAELDPAKVNALKEVSCLPLSVLLNGLAVSHVNLFVLDCEGCELSVLRSIDFFDVSFDVLVVETLRVDAIGQKKEIADFFASIDGPHKYNFWQQKGRNSWFVREGFVPSPAPA